MVSERAVVREERMGEDVRLAETWWWWGGCRCQPKLNRNQCKRARRRAWPMALGGGGLSASKGTFRHANEDGGAVSLLGRHSVAQARGWGSCTSTAAPLQGDGGCQARTT